MHVFALRIYRGVHNTQRLILLLISPQIDRIRDEISVPKGNRPSFPDDIHRPQYRYSQPPRAICEHVFYKRFYGRSKPCKKHGLLFSRLRCTRSCRKSIPGVSILERIPKRIYGVEDNLDEEILWGLAAVLKPTFFRVTVYSMLIFTPSIVFWFMWLFSWGHAGDLQNASIPLITTITVLMPLFWYYISLM